MPDQADALDIAKNARTLDWLRAELVGSAAQVLRDMARGEEEGTVDALATNVIIAYLLARRAGVEYAALDQTIRARLQDIIAKEHEIERWYGDATSLAEHLRHRRSRSERTSSA